MAEDSGEAFRFEHIRRLFARPLNYGHPTTDFGFCSGDCDPCPRKHFGGRIEKGHAVAVSCQSDSLLARSATDICDGGQVQQAGAQRAGAQRVRLALLL